MSRVAVLGSNALATAVQFYAAALEEAVQRADRADAMLKQVAAQTHSRAEWNTLLEQVRTAIADGNRSDLEKVAAIVKALDTFDGPELPV